MMKNHRTMTRAIGLMLALLMLVSCALGSTGGMIAAAVTESTLYLKPNGGQWPDYSTTVRQYRQAAGTTFTPTQTPIRDGFEFVGWQLNGTGGSWDGTTFTFGNTDCSLSAVWEQKMQTLNLMGGTWFSITNPVDLHELKIMQQPGTTVTLPTNIYQEKFVFRGWQNVYTDNTGSAGTVSGSIIERPYSNTDGSTGEMLIGRYTYTFGTAVNAFLYPNFQQLQPNKAAVSVDPVGGTWQDSIGGTETRVLIQDRDTRYWLPTVVKEGYLFNRWRKLAGSGNNTTDDGIVFFGEGTSSVVADWIDLSAHTLTLDPDGGTWGDGSTLPRTVSQVYNTTYTLPTDLTKEGYHLAGWTVQTPTNPSPAIHMGSITNNVYKFGDGEATVKPVWTPLYTITIDWDDGIWLQPGMDTLRSRLFDEPIVYQCYEGQTILIGNIFVPSIDGDPLNAVQSWEYRPTWTCSRGTINEGRWTYTAGNGPDTIRPSLDRTNAVGAGCVFILGGDYRILPSLGNRNGAYWADLGEEDATYMRFMLNDPEWTNTVNGVSSAFQLPELIRPGYTLSGWKIYKHSKLVEDPANDNAGTVFEYNGVWYYTFDNTCMERLDLCPVWTKIPNDQLSVTIGDQIGVNLLLDLDARNAETVTVVYKDLDGVEQTETFTDFASLPKTDDGLYKIAVQIAPAQIADSVTVYIDGETLDASVKDYCNTLAESGEYEPEVVALAQAVLDYGQAANNFFHYSDDTLSSLADLSADDAKAWEKQFSDTTGKISAMSFMALTKPEFRFYMRDLTVKQAAAYNEAGVTAAYANGNITDTLHARFVRNTQGNILIEVTGVQAEYMDETIVVTVNGLGTITFAGNDFAGMMADNASMETLGAALYAYGAAAKACFAQ